MTKAERRKRARARAREREQAAQPPDALERAVEAVAAAPEPLRDAEAESEFITGPVAPREIDRRVVRGTTLGGELIADRQRRLRAEARAEDADDEADEEVDEDDLISGDEDEDEDEDDELDEQEDALFEVACAAVEQGDALSWQEFASLLVTAEVTDPRLALLIGLIMEGAPEGEGDEIPKHVPLPLTGARVLATLKELSLGELVEEAREVTELSPGGDESEDERALVRTSARELNALSKRELADGKHGDRGTKNPGRPLRASDVKARRTALSTGAMGSRRQG